MSHRVSRIPYFPACVSRVWMNSLFTRGDSPNHFPHRNSLSNISLNMCNLGSLCEFHSFDSVRKGPKRDIDAVLTKFVVLSHFTFACLMQYKHPFTKEPSLSNKEVPLQIVRWKPRSLKYAAIHHEFLSYCKLLISSSISRYRTTTMAFQFIFSKYSREDGSLFLSSTRCTALLLLIGRLAQADQQWYALSAPKKTVSISPLRVAEMGV